jgi:hypothetical protein
MKQKKLTTLGALLVAVATLTVNSSALTTIQIQKIKTDVLSVPVPEMPAKAAELVQGAEKKDRQAVALTAVRAVVAKHRAAAPLVVAAIAKVAPDLTAVVAKASVEIAPDQATSIVTAGIAAAPSEASSIRTSVSASTTSITPITRGSASPGPGTGGTATISDTPINGGAFPSNPPTPASDPRVIYNQPPN